MRTKRNIWLRREIARCLGKFGFILLTTVSAVVPAAAQNMLNNPGFEKGTMGYWWFTWSQQSGDGSLRYTLTSDSHSGSYALQIACIPGGTDCQLGSLISDWMLANPGQAYTFSAWVKCPVGASGLVQIDDNLSGANDNNFSCTGTWQQYSVTHTQPAGSQYLDLRVFDSGGLPMQIDDLALTYADGTAPAHIVLHPGTRNVTFNSQYVSVDGAPYFPLGFYGVPDADVAAVAATGATTLHGVGSYSPADVFNTGSKSFLDTVYEAGMTFVPDSSTTAVAAGSNPAAYSALIPAFAPHLANIAWSLGSEIDFSQFPATAYASPANFNQDYLTAKAYTQLPTMNQMQHATYQPADDAPYAPSTDIWSVETYGPTFSYVQSAQSAMLAIAQKPLWAAHDNPGASLIVPKAYYAVVNGATGLFYYDWTTFKQDPAQLAAVEQVFTELKALYGPIFGSKMDSLVTPPSGIAAMSRYSQGTSYILAVNPNAQTAGGNFVVQGLKAGQQVNVMFENRTITATANGFSDTFAGIARHVYAISAPSTSLTSSLTNKTGTAPARTWTVQVFDSGMAAANNSAITNVTFSQPGANHGTSCTPVVASGALPYNLGSISPAQAAVANLNIDFTGCDSTSKFTVGVTVSAANAPSATTTLANQKY